MNSYNSAKFDLKNLIKQGEDADGKIEKLKLDIAAAEPEIASAEKQLDDFEIKG